MPAPVVIVGASMGGLRTAESLRRFGYAGPITVIGDEPYAPYNRPPLSKEVLAAEVSHEAVAFPQRPATADVHWMLGQAARSAELAEHTVTLADGSTVPFSKLVIATGLRPKRAELVNGELAGRHVIRSLDDAIALRAAIRPGVRVVVFGAGFIGCETAATMRKLGAEVTIVARGLIPLEHALGAELGREIQRRHEAQSVRFVLGRSIVGLRGEERLTAVELDNGELLDADVLIEAIGSVPNTEWLADTELDLSDGVLCDTQLRAVGVGGQSVPDVFAIGDVARFVNPLFGEDALRVEHWNIPTECAKHVAKVIAAELAGSEAPSEHFIPVPSFWSDQYDMHILAFGLPALADSNRLVQGELSGDCVFEYERDGRLLGVVGIGLRSVVQSYRQRFESAER